MDMDVAALYRIRSRCLSCSAKGSEDVSKMEQRGQGRSRARVPEAGCNSLPRTTDRDVRYCRTAEEATVKHAMT